jgi:hypothetical protein
VEALVLLAPFLVPFGLVAALIVYAIRKAFHSAAPAGRAEVLADAERWLDAEQGDLLPWDEGAIADLSDTVSTRYATFVNTTTKGRVAAVSRRDPLALYVSVTGPAGQHLLARTTAHRWRMEVTRGPRPSGRGAGTRWCCGSGAGTGRGHQPARRGGRWVGCGRSGGSRRAGCSS